MNVFVIHFLLRIEPLLLFYTCGDATLFPIPIYLVSFSLSQELPDSIHNTLLDSSFVDILSEVFPSGIIQREIQEKEFFKQNSLSFYSSPTDYSGLLAKSPGREIAFSNVLKTNKLCSCSDLERKSQEGCFLKATASFIQHGEIKAQNA